MRYSFTIILILLLFSVGCNITKNLPEGKKMVVDNEIQMSAKWPKAEKRKLESDLLDLAVPEPNGKPYLKVWFYQHSRDTSKGFNRWLRKRLAAPPALLDSSEVRESAKKMTSYLFNKGYFDANVNYEIAEKANEAKVEVKYSVSPHTLSYFGDIAYEISDSTIEMLVKQDSTLRKMAKVKPFDMEALVDERSRITNKLINNGYYGFSRQFVKFELDTLPSADTIDVYVQVLQPEEGRKHQQYFIGDVTIIPDYNESLHQVKEYDTLNYKGYDILYRDLNYNPQAIIDGVFLLEDSLYRRTDYQQTINRLTSLQVFRFVNIELIPYDEDGKQYLDAIIKLIPAKQREISGNINATSSSYYFLGSEVGVNYVNKNLFQYTDVFSLGLNGGVEMLTDTGKQFLILNTIEFKLDANFYFPKLVNPLGFKINQQAYNPRTSIKTRYSYFRRLSYYTLNSVNFSYNYEWKQTEKIGHAVTPLDLNFVRLTDTTQAFSERLSNNPILRQSFDDQLIIGSGYSFIYNNNPKRNKRKFWYFRGNIDVAGNLLNAGYNLFTESQTNGDANNIFGLRFSQYIRPDIEFKYYYNLTSKQTLATRFLAGVGVPLGNSEVLPYVKQFVIGGSNSIRAFRVRQLGPGQTGNDGSTIGFNDRTGEMKLEANVEYRFPIYDIFKGAVFVDAGNIWMLEDKSNPERVFFFDRFYKDIAIGTGAGLRLDFSFFIIRLDLGIPVYVPYDEAYNGWRINSFFNEFDLFKSNWRRDHLTLNLAIGYPF